MASSLIRLQVLTHCNPIGGKVWNPAIRWTDKYAVFVKLHDDTGAVGLGECWCFDAAPDALVAFLRTEVLPHFAGIALDDVPDVAGRLTERATLSARHGMLASALSGIDIAAWDLRAQQQEKPVWQVLPSGGNGEVTTYASGGLYGEDKTTADLCNEMAGYAAAGFHLSKMKIGGLTVAEDVARVRAVLDALPSQAKLIIDGVYSYTADEALRVFEALPPERVEAFQSPTRATDYAGMARLSQAGVPVMATEAEYRPELHDRLVQEAGVAFLQTAPIACGGLTRVLELGALVRDTPTRLSLEVSSTAIALMAAIQAAAADPEIAHVEYHRVHTVFFDTLDLRRGQIPPHSHTPPDTPGLGITLPEDSCTLAFDTMGAAAPKTAA